MGRPEATSASSRTAGWLATAIPRSLAEADILVVDDHAPNVALLERLLQAAGMTEIEVLMDSRRVVERCLERQPDLLLLDLHMPHLDGYEVLAALRDALPAHAFLPVLVLTADASTAARERALEAGAKDFLVKPLDRVETIQRVRNLLETRMLYRAIQEHNSALQAELDHHTESERRLAADREERRTRIEQILRDGTVTMVFQPIADLDSMQIVGVEALARFDQEPRRPPNEWFADAADVDRGAELELAAVTDALAQLAELPAPAFMSVNVSPATALRAELVAALRTVPGSRVMVELTEHSRVDDYEPLLAALDRLRAEGARIAVDDAGAGYAGLQHLLRLRPDIIKLDIDLTRGIDADPIRRALARSLVAFAAEIGATIVAEGIESTDELATLRALGVPWGQGYHLARPGPDLPHGSLRIAH